VWTKTQDHACTVGLRNGVRVGENREWTAVGMVGIGVGVERAGHSASKAGHIAFKREHSAV